MTRALRLLALCSVAASCAPSGEEPLSRLETWEAPGGVYRIRYLSPPWRIVEERPEGAFFLIESAVMSLGGVDGGTGKYELRTSTVPRAVATEMERTVRDAERMSGRSIVAGPRAITTRDGAEGRELVTFDLPDPAQRFQRVVLFSLGRSRTLRLDFSATPDLDTAEVTEMIRHVGVGGAP